MPSRSLLVPALAALMAPTLIAAGIVAAAPRSAAQTPTSAGVFVPLQGRLLDTRTGLGGYSSPMTGGVTRSLHVTNSNKIPSDVSTVAVTLTVVNATSFGTASVSGTGDPFVTNLLYNAGDTVSNTAIAAVHSDGAIAVHADHQVDLVIDVQGYFTTGAATAPGGFIGVAGSRIVDTRIGMGAAKARVESGGVVTITVAGTAGVPSGAVAAFVNVAVINPSANGFLRLYAAGQSPTAAFSSNFSSGGAFAIGTTVPLNSAGAMAINVAAGGPLDIVVDVQGYFTPTAGSATFTPDDERIFDTRTTTSPLAPNTVTTVQVAGTGAIPREAQSVMINLVAVNDSGANGYLRAWPTGAAEPGTSSLNLEPSRNYRSNSVVVAPGSGGLVSIRNASTAPVDLVIDAQGWFVAATPAAPGVGSDAYPNGQYSVAVPSADFRFTSLPPATLDTNTAAADFVWSVDGGPTQHASADSNGTASVSVTVTSPGLHYLLCTAEDAHELQSQAVLYTWWIGDPANNVDDPDPSDPTTAPAGTTSGQLADGSGSIYIVPPTSSTDDSSVSRLATNLESTASTGTAPWPAGMAPNARFRWGWISGTLYFNKRETRNLMWIGTALGVIANLPTVAYAFQTLLKAYLGYLMSEAGYANANNRCVKVKVPSFAIQTYRGGYCK